MLKKSRRQHTQNQQRNFLHLSKIVSFVQTFRAVATLEHLKAKRSLELRLKSSDQAIFSFIV